MTHQDWVEFGEALILSAAVGLAGLYLLEWAGSLRKRALQRANKVIWKKPKRWQVVTVCALWSFVVAGFVLLLWIRRAN
jgi:hypothetical protein